MCAHKVNKRRYKHTVFLCVYARAHTHPYIHIHICTYLHIPALGGYTIAVVIWGEFEKTSLNMIILTDLFIK